MPKRLQFHRNQSRIVDPSLVPAKTESYVPLPNSVFIEKIENMVDRAGFSIVDRRFKSTRDVKVVFGTFALNDNDTGIRTQVGMINSYDKSRKAGIAIGAQVHKCSNLSFSSMKKFRVHTGRNFFRDVNAILQKAQDNLQNESNKVRQRYMGLRQVPLKDSSISYLMGKLFYDGVIKVTQLNLLRKQLKGQKSYVFGRDNLFDFNMHVTEVLEGSHPYHLIENFMDSERIIARHAMQLDSSLNLPMP